MTKAGEVRESRVTDAEPSTLAKKCGFKNASAISKHASWPAAGEPDVTIELWGRIEGRAGSENKYDFPPPVDSALFFGSCCLVARRQHNATIEDLHAETWARTYEKLFGGFEDLTQEEDPSSDELDDVAAEMKTECGGYLRDGFVTDGEDDDSDDGSGGAGDEEGSAVSLSGDSSEEDDDEVPLESDSEEGGELEESDYDYSDGDEDNEDKPEIECA